MEVEGRISNGAGVEADGLLRPSSSGGGVELISRRSMAEGPVVTAEWSSVARFTYCPRSWKGAGSSSHGRWLVIARSEALAFEASPISVDDVTWLRETADLGVVHRWPGPPLRRQLVGYLFAPLLAAVLFVAWIIFLEPLGIDDPGKPLDRLVLLAVLPAILALFGFIDRRLLQRRPKPAASARR